MLALAAAVYWTALLLFEDRVVAAAAALPLGEAAAMVRAGDPRAELIITVGASENDRPRKRRMSLAQTIGCPSWSMVTSVYSLRSPASAR